MSVKLLQIEIDDQTYDIFVTTKYQKHIYFRFKNNAFYVTCPPLTSKKTILQGIEKFAPRLIKKSIKEQKENYSFDKGFIYLFGVRYDLKMSDKFRIEDNCVFAKNHEDLVKNLRKLLVNYLSESVRKYEKEMNIKKPYKISVKKMKTRYGSNSLKTHRLHFQIDLVHFSFAIIDSVVVHELAHEFYRNHQRGFYSCVLKYCPDYYLLKKKLRQKVYS